MQLTCPSLSAIPHIRHGFFTRQGGISDGIYASLNCGPGSGDIVGKVMENRARVAKALGQGPTSLVTCHQIHSPNVKTVGAPWEHKDAPQADAMVTGTPGITLGILTADCLPILFADTKTKVIGAAHAGWKGAFDGVIEAALEGMRNLGAHLPDIQASIGPGIAQASYEVGPEFYARFVQQDIANSEFFKDAPRHGHHLFDLKAYCAMRLKKAGLSHINILANDTCLEEDAFFSFRRATLRKEPSYGRQISAIVMAE